VVVVLCNCPPEEASPLARSLVESGLAACVNIVPGVTSVYLWKGELCEDGESTLLIKTTTDRVEELSDRIRALHSYEVPEILVLGVDVSLSDRRYVDWVKLSTRRA